MPVNLREIQGQIRVVGEQARKQEEYLRLLSQQANSLLQTYDEQLDLLREYVKDNAAARCAVPCQERLSLAVLPPKLNPPLAILAADGSQIIPDRHQAVEFGVINIGVLGIYYGQEKHPQEFTRTRLLYPNVLDPEDELLTEETINLERDLWERELLAELATAESQPIIALTDGPLELYREPKESPKIIEKFQNYLRALARACESGVISAGYVDRPKADLVTRLLELTLSNANERPLKGVTDAFLYQDILGPDQRSAVFSLQSSSARKFKEYSEHLALHFFYLNVGTPEHPSLARVEIPEWVASAPAMVDVLHAALIWQCRQMGTQAYPYSLHRAHEIAVISYQERYQVETMISRERLQAGLGYQGKSAKQAHKDSMGTKKRYGQ